ncbi:response regulator [Roseococcus sp.]|uniref:hybrid sensor histidine kinase/response regulator n=1 Tax=Roseococcus sp. TaxID=2109646 RepID=UPI003BABE172
MRERVPLHLAEASGLPDAGYAAHPVAWPDASPFGVLDALDLPASLEPERCLRLMAQFARAIEDQLSLLWSRSEIARLEVERLAQRERMALATEVSGIGIWDYNIDGDVLLCDETCLAIYGMPGETGRMKSMAAFKALIHPEDVDRITDERMAELAMSKQDRQVEFRLLRPSGEMRWITSAACMLPATSVTPNRLVGVVVDITEARQAAEVMRASYDALRRAERLSKVGSWTLHLDTGHFDTSAMLYEMNGADPEGPSLTVADLQNFLAPESFQAVSEAVARCARTGEPYGIDATHFRPDGSSFAVHIRGEALYGAGGDIVALTGTVQDISEREESRARLQALADNLPNGAIYRLERQPDGGYRLTYVSAGIEKLIGVRPEEIIANRGAFLAAIHREDVGHYLLEVEKSRTTGTVFDCEFRACRPDGSMIWMRCRSAPRSAAAGTAWDGIMLDITREKDAAREVQLAKEAAEAGERAKSDFLATMSHEIRTPMNTVIGMARLVQQTDLSAKQRNYLQKIDVSAKALLSIINDVLDYSKIEAGMLALDISEFDLDEVLEAVSAATSARAEEKGLEIAYSIAHDLPRRLRGDAFRLGQVLINLVGNAVKFTKVGEIVVSVEVEEGGMIAFSVRDTGIGLTPEQISHLFRPFSQAEANTSRRYGGTGLGLAICQRLVTLMGGTIGVESVPDWGSTFRFVLPIAPAREREPAAAQLPQPSALAGARALIVDDNASAREILSEILRAFGMRVDSAASGVEGLHAVRESCRDANPYEIVLMDWRMPGMDGLEVARRLREDERLAHMPAVLMVTAYGREEILKRAEELGLQGLLIKPITASVMFNTLIQILRPLAPVQTSLAPPAHPLTPNADYGLAGRRVLVVDDNALNREVATDFLELAGVIVTTANNGREALESLEDRVFDAVLMDIHMPEMDGLEATRAIRRQPQWADLPIIALTAQARAEDRFIVADAGMNAHLAKPIDEAALYSVLAKAIADRAAGGPVAEPAPRDFAAERPARAIARIDMAAIEERFGISSARIIRLFDGFLRDFSGAPAECERLASGDDLPAAAMLVHTLKGSMGYLGADLLGDTAERIEDAARLGDVATLRQALPGFARDLRLLLAEVAAERGRVSQEAGVPAPSPAPVLTLIAELRSLIESGDYGAVAKLERLSEHLRQPDQIALVAQMREEVDDLRRDEALVSLRHLAATLPEFEASDE